MTEILPFELEWVNLTLESLEEITNFDTSDIWLLHICYYMLEKNISKDMKLEDYSSTINHSTNRLDSRRKSLIRDLFKWINILLNSSENNDSARTNFMKRVEALMQNKSMSTEKHTNIVDITTWAARDLLGRTYPGVGAWTMM